MVRPKPDRVLHDLSLAIEHPERIDGFSPRLSWSHYRALTKVEARPERLFYEIEAEKEGWSVPHLERQIHTLLFARLLKSRNKAGVLELARDLHTTPPRSPRETLGGFVIAARMVDKARADLLGIHGEYNFYP